MFSHSLTGLLLRSLTHSLTHAVQDTVLLTGPDSALPQALAHLHAVCNDFQQGCAEQVLLLESHEVAAFMHLQTSQQAQDIARQHGVRVSLEVDQAGVAALHTAEIQVSPVPITNNNDVHNPHHHT